MSYSQNPLNYKGFNIHYSLYGKGNPVICLHGLNLDGRIFATKNMRELLADKTILALDLPGYGKSEFLPKANFAEIGAVITELADKLGLKHFELCGFCLGGIFALDYAIRNKDRVTKLYLIETMIYLPWWLYFCNTVCFGFLYNRLSRNKLCLSLLSKLPALKGLAKMKSLTLIHNVWNNRVNSFYLNLMKEYQSINHVQRSRIISCQTELFYSEKSFRNIRKTNQELHTAIRKSALHRLQAAGHFSMM